MNIEQDIALWDGKTVSDIQAVYDKYHSGSNFADSIVKLSLTQTYERGATWVLKAWLEAGNTLEERQVTAVYRSLKN